MNKQGQRLAIQLRLPSGMTSQGFEFGAEEECLALTTVIKRLLADAITSQHQAAVLAIPQRESEHANEILQGRFDAPSLDCGQHCFRIGMPTPSRRFAGILKPRAQIDMVVDLPVENEYITP